MVMAVRPALRMVKLSDDEVSMSGCEREVMVSPYHDGELTPDARGEFEAHLASCPACSAELHRVRGVSRWLEPLRQPALTPGKKEALYLEAVRRAAGGIGEEAGEGEGNPLKMRPGRAVRWVRWVTAAAAAVFLFSVIQLFPAQVTQPGDRDNGGPGGSPVWKPEQEVKTPRRGAATTPATIPTGKKSADDAPESGGNGTGAQPAEEGV
jgi:hypothetical protein